MNIITAQTQNLGVEVRSKVNYALWSIMYLSSATPTVFRGYNWNMGAIKLDIVENNVEYNYGERKTDMDNQYFCLNGSNNTQNSFASFLDFDKFISFMVSSLKNRTNSIKTFKTSNVFTKTEDQMAENIAEFVTNQWPNKKTTDVFKDQRNTDNIKNRIETIKLGISKAKSLGL